METPNNLRITSALRDLVRIGDPARFAEHVVFADRAAICRFRHGVAQALVQIPGRVVAYPQPTAEFNRGDALLRAGHQVQARNHLVSGSLMSAITMPAVIDQSDATAIDVALRVATAPAWCTCVCRTATNAAKQLASVLYSCSNPVFVEPLDDTRIAPIPCPAEGILHQFPGNTRAGRLAY